MSYDLYLLRTDAEGAAEAYERLEEEAEAAEREPDCFRGRTSPTARRRPPSGEPRTRPLEPQHGFELQRRYESERPVVIDIYVGSITMSWSYGATDAAPALAEVERYIPVFERHGYVAYDPQLEHIYEPSRDQADAAEIHRDVRERLFEQTSGDRRPWWKRLLG